MLCHYASLSPLNVPFTLFLPCRKQFDRANMEAMDESAHWRMKYDGEVERARHYAAELLQVTSLQSQCQERVPKLFSSSIFLFLLDVRFECNLVLTLFLESVVYTQLYLNLYRE